jgi:hypothetical protein
MQENLVLGIQPSSKEFSKTLFFGVNPSLAGIFNFGISPKPHCRLIILFWPLSVFRRAVFRLTAYFLALPAIPPVTLKNHFNLFAGWRQPNANFKAWVHRLFARLSSGPAEASIKTRIGWDFLCIDSLLILAIRRVAFLAIRLERSSR